MAENEQGRADARKTAREAAKPGDWLSAILDHHLQIEAAFGTIPKATSAEARKAALKALGVVLAGHAQAEELAIYPAIAWAGDKAGAKSAYDEQVEAKMAMAELETMDPMTEAFLDKLGEIKAAVQHHVFEEEGTWFPELARKASAEDAATMRKNYLEQFERYVGGDAPKTREAGIGERPSFTA